MLHLNGLNGSRIAIIDSKLRAKLTGRLCTDSRCPKKQKPGRETSVHRLIDSTPSFTLGEGGGNG